jgi:hypothetical protein
MYLAKFVEQLLKKTNLDASESAKNTFCEKSSFKHFRFGRSKSPVKGLN